MFFILFLCLFVVQGQQYVTIGFGSCGFYPGLQRVADKDQCAAAFTFLTSPGNSLDFYTTTTTTCSKFSPFTPGCIVEKDSSDNDELTCNYRDDPDNDASAIENTETYGRYCTAKFATKTFTPCVCATTSILPACTNTNGLVKNTEPCLCGSSKIYSAPPYVGKIYGATTDATMDTIGEYCITNQELIKDWNELVNTIPVPANVVKDSAGQVKTVDHVSFCPFGSSSPG